MSFKDLTKKLHDAAFSDDGDEAKPVPPPASPRPTEQVAVNPWANTPAVSLPQDTSTSAAASPFIVPNTTVLDEAVYQRVLDKTNFDKTPVGQIIHKYFDALDDAGFDANTRFRTAIRQAGKLEGITPDKVIQAFDDLRTALQAESDKFTRAVEGQTQKEIVGRQQQLQQISDQITQLTQQINDLQSKHTQISAELVDANSRIANAQTQMQLASSRRAQEIDTQKAQFNGLLR
jgi:hypothetical protein